MERLPGFVALGCAALGLALLLALPAGLFSGDEGIKLIQSQALVDSGWSGFALPYPGAAADPEGLHFPLSPPFVWEHEGSRYGIYSFEYTAVAALFWRLGGLRAVFVLSWLGAAVALWLLARLAARLAGPGRAALVVLAAAAGTPLLLYGTTNYEHTWGCALILALLLLLAAERPGVKRLLAAGALLGLAAVIRPELALFAPAVAAFAFVYWGARRATLGRLAWIGASTAGVVGVHLLLNLKWFGSPHPNALAADHPASTWQTSLEKLASPDAPAATWWVLAIALGLGLLPADGRRLYWVRSVGALLVMGFVFAASWRAMGAVSPEALTGSRTLIGLFTATPLAVVGLLRGPGRFRGDLAGALAAAGAVFVVGVALVRIPGFWGGLEMGSRYLLPAALLLLLAAADGVERIAAAGGLRPAFGACVAGLLLLSVAATAVNAGSLATLKGSSAGLVAAVEQAGIDDVVAGRFWAPQLLAPLYLEKRIYRPTSNFLYPDLYASGARRFLAVHSDQRPGRFRRIVLTRQRVIAPDVVVFAMTQVPPGGWEEPLPAEKSGTD